MRHALGRGRARLTIGALRAARDERRKGAHAVAKGAMNRNRIASLCVALVAPLGAIQCEPADGARSPATPENAAGSTGTSNEAKAAPAPPSVAAGGGDTANLYASDEIAIGAESEGYSDDDPAALTDFHAALAPHGTWADDSTYGTVWVPSPAVVGADFQPYVSAGHWVYDDDWVWVSDYDWGWAPFHYGRWVWIEGRGWSWIPGRAYRGAWVLWGVDDGYSYVGWAPMSPSFIWFGGVAVGFPGYARHRWVYCPRGDVFSPAVRTRVVVGTATASVAARVRPYVPATPGVASAGPPPQKLGFQGAQIPHATDANAAGIARAQQFSRPSTALALGARAPTRMPIVGQAATATAIGQTPRAVAGEPIPRGPAAGQVPRGPATVQVPGGPAAGSAPHMVERAPPPARVAPVGVPTPSPGRVPAPGGFTPPAAAGRSAAPPPVRVAPSPRATPGPSVRGGGRVR
jgi:hypothetical protein